MRIANLAGRAVIVTDSGAIDIEGASDGRFGPDPSALFRDWAGFAAWARSADLPPGTAYDDEDLGAPVPEPGQVFAIGLNYRAHAAESGVRDLPTEPPVFTKFRGSITGPVGELELPTDTVDWEAELTVVIGTTAHRVPAEHAWEHVAGLTIAQDYSDRTRQLVPPVPQFSLGKSFPGFLPMGPAVVTVDELRDDGLDPDDLAIGCTIDGEVVQDGRTSDLIFSVPVLIERLSAVLPLQPGDLILTGTPAGVGGGMTPPRFLTPGEEVVTTIDGLGALRQRCVAGIPHTTAVAS